MFCGSQAIVQSSHWGQVACPVKCRRWGCPNCQEWRQRCLMARCIEGKPNRFISFTCRRGRYATEAETAKAMTWAWRTIIQRWRRLNPWHKCEYIAVFEPHKSGWPHMHILWKGHWLSQKWLSEQAKQLLDSPIQDVRLVRDAKHAAFYVAKYFSKEPQKFGTCKRYWTSKNWPKLKVIDADQAFHKGFPIDLIDRHIDGIVAEWHRNHKETWKKPPDVVGWGVLVSWGQTAKNHKPPVWNEHFGFRVIRPRRGRTALAEGR